MSMKSLLAGASLALGLCLLGAAGANAANVLVNGGFETGALGPWYQARDFNGHGGSNWSVENTFVSGGSYAATAGDNYELRQDFAGVSTSSISSVTVDAATSIMAYDLFYTDGSDQEFSFSGSASAFQTYNLTANLASGKLLDGISFWGNTGGAAFIDNVSINVAGGVPEPASWALMLAGVGGVGAVLRIRRRKAVAA